MLIIEFGQRWRYFLMVGFYRCFGSKPVSIVSRLSAGALSRIRMTTNSLPPNFYAE
jgi:hypothetical protein